MRSFVIDKKYDEKNVSKVLYDSFPALTKNTLYKTFRQKDIKINGTRIHEDVIVHANDEVQIFVVDELLYPTFSPDIVYEDENILVMNKSAGIEVVGENSLTTCVRKFLKEQNKTSISNDVFLKPSHEVFLEPCHRLDRNTTGLVLFAKNKETFHILLKKFRIHEIEKHYIAKVYGIPKTNEQTMTAYLFKDNKKSIVYISDEPKKGYIEIITSYSILEKHIKENYSVLDVTLHTGKTHQIRAHLAHIGYPILGDGKYGNNQINKQFGFKTQQLCSYFLKFNFTTDAGVLNYLNGKEIKLKINN